MNNVEMVQDGATVFVDVIEQLQKHLAQPNADYPHDLIEQIIQQREYVTPKLLEIVESFLTASPRDMPHNKWLEGIVALFILAKLREQKAFPFLIRLCSIPHNAAEPFLGDIKTEQIPEFLASTFNGDWKALYSVVSNQHLNEYLRGAVLDAYVILYKNNMMSREEVVNVFSDLFNELYDDYSVVPSFLVSHCCDIQATELHEQIKKYFDNDIVEELLVSRDDINKAFSLPRNDALKKFHNNSFFNFVDDLEGCMKWLFRKDEDEETFDNYDDDADGNDRLPFVSSTPSIGRNAPCLCGSRKKYKKCCLNKDDLPF